MANFDDVIDFYLHDIYKICFYLVQDQKLAHKLTRQTFLEFYDRFENVKEGLVFAELVSITKKLAEIYKVNSEGRKYEAKT